MRLLNGEVVFRHPPNDDVPETIRRDVRGDEPEITDGVAYLLTTETTRMAGRIEDGKKIPGISKAHFKTAPFTAGELGEISADVSFDWGKASGKVMIGGKPCVVSMLSMGKGSYQEVKYDPGFYGICKLEGEKDDLEFNIGVVP